MYHFCVMCSFSVTGQNRRRRRRRGEVQRGDLGHRGEVLPLIQKERIRELHIREPDTKEKSAQNSLRLRFTRGYARRCPYERVR